MGILCHIRVNSIENSKNIQAHIQGCLMPNNRLFLLVKFNLSYGPFGNKVASYWTFFLNHCGRDRDHL